MTKRTSVMGKLWATQEAMNALEAHGLTNRRLDGGRYIAVYKKTRQPTCTAKDLEKAMAELRQMEQMERAVTQCSGSQIDAAVASAAVQMAIQQAAEQLADSTYQEQRGPLMAAMQSRVQEAALMHNAKRAATEVGGKEPNAKRGPGAT